jgi:hypothetical protein
MTAQAFTKIRATDSFPITNITDKLTTRRVLESRSQNKPQPSQFHNKKQNTNIKGMIAQNR